MTLRGCVLGNSHLAAVRIAAARPGAIPAGLTLDFIGSAQSGLSHVAVQGSMLIATDAATLADFQRFGGVSEVDLGRYDFFVLVGLGLNIYGLDSLYRGFHFNGLQNWRLPDGKRQLISRAVARTLIANRLAECLSVRLARLLRQASDRPIFLQAQPRPAKAMLEPGGKFPAFRAMLRRGDAAAMADLFEETAAACLPEIYLPQPAQTVEDSLFTAAAFSDGSARLTPDVQRPALHPKADFLHANAAYGGLVLQQIAAAATAQTAGIP